MATAAGDFLSVHLAIIVRVLDISENLAGVTIFAFGNGSSDLFSTLAAMDSNNGSLAISELFGAAAFIVTVVLGLVMVVRPFSVDPSTFVGDVLWFIIAAATLMAFIADGHLTMRECLGIIGLYVAFVCFAILRARNPRKETSAAERSDVQGFEGQRELSESGVEPLDENIPLLGPGNPLMEAQITSTGHAERRESCSSEEISIDGGPDANVVVRIESTARRELRSDSSSATPIVSGTEPQDTYVQDQSKAEKALSVFSMPFLVPIRLTTPTVRTGCAEGSDILINLGQPEKCSTVDEADDQRRTNRALAGQTQDPSKPRLLMEQLPVYVPLILGPQFVGLVLIQQSGLFGSSTSQYLPVCLGSAMLSAILILCTSNIGQPRGSHVPASSHLFTSTLGFATSLVWIYLTATSAVSLLTTLGMILRIPNAVLGATIFAIGNSSNDLVADVAVARRGFPVLAASACFGGPMMNMLLGIGGGGLVQVLRHPGGKEPSFEVSPSLFVSGATLVVALIVTLGYSFCNSWELDRRLGLSLIGIWTVSTIGVVGMSLTTV